LLSSTLPFGILSDELWVDVRWLWILCGYCESDYSYEISVCFLSRILIWRRYIENIMVVFPVFKQFPTLISHSWVCNDSNCPFLNFKNLVTIRLVSPNSYSISHNRMSVRKVDHSQGLWRHYSLDHSNCNENCI
jgi:hypothetical protein